MVWKQPVLTSLYLVFKDFYNYLPIQLQMDTDPGYDHQFHYISKNPLGSNIYSVKHYPYWAMTKKVGFTSHSVFCMYEISSRAEGTRGLKGNNTGK